MFDKMKYVLDIYNKLPNFPSVEDLAFEIFKKIQNKPFEKTDIFLYIDKRKWSEIKEKDIQRLFNEALENGIILKQDNLFLVKNDQ